MPFDAADIVAFNDSDLPGYALATIGAASVAGRFRAVSQDAFGVVITDRASFAAAASDLSTVAVDSSIVIAGTTYTVAEVLPHDAGTGMTRLMLKS
jgi:hypothetical protein